MTAANERSKASITISQLQRWLLAAMTVAVVIFTLGVFVLVQRIFDNFGPGVAADLEWKTERGAQELARAADLGLAVRDAEAVTQAFGEYASNDDVVAIAAQAVDGTPLAWHGRVPAAAGDVFAGPAATVRQAGDLLIAWAPAVVEGAPVGKVAIVVTTRRIVESRQFLTRLSYGTLCAGLMALVGGILTVNFFTRSIATRDAQLADYASGLERRVAERTAELARINQGMRLVLDNVEQGFITTNLDGVMAPERSTVCDRWFGARDPKATLMDMVSLRDSTVASWLGLGLEELREDLMPVPLILDQMPSRIQLDERTMRLTYQPIYQANKLERLLVVVTDVTQDLLRERAERDSREMARIFRSIVSDRNGFVQFLEEIGVLVDRLEKGKDSPDVDRRSVHTIKGNCDLYGLESLASLCHELETTLGDENRGMNADERLALSNAWAHVRALVQPLLGERRIAIELEEHDYRALLAAIRTGAPPKDLAEMVLSWRREPVCVRFARLADKAEYLAQRLGKDPVVVHQDAHGLRLDAGRWNGFWSAAIHAITNALDHGIESHQRRSEGQKPAAGNLWFEAEEDGNDGLVISFRDDGGGVDWAKVAERARQQGLPHQGHVALVEALFANGVSTRDEASITAGRGTGMGALREAVRDLGGRIDITSRLGHGTTVECRFPPECAAAVNAA